MYALDPTYQVLRETAFAWEDANVCDGAPAGFVLEAGYPGAAFTLAALSDGAVSLYFSGGGGITGAGGYPCTAAAADEVLRLARGFADHMPGARLNPIPRQGEARMYVLMENGLRGVHGPESEFGDGRSPFSPLFLAAHRVVEAISRRTRQKLN